MSYPADPGGAFATDVHRRVMANAPNPDEPRLAVDEIRDERIAKDDHLALATSELETVLAELIADGHLSETKAGFKNTRSGWLALTNQEWGA